jgi:hypothetical protein
VLERKIGGRGEGGLGVAIEGCVEAYGIAVTESEGGGGFVDVADGASGMGKGAKVDWRGVEGEEVVGCCTELRDNSELAWNDTKMGRDGTLSYGWW